MDVGKFHINDSDVVICHYFIWCLRPPPSGWKSPFATRAKRPVGRLPSWGQACDKVRLCNRTTAPNSNNIAGQMVWGLAAAAQFGPGSQLLSSPGDPVNCLNYLQLRTWLKMILLQLTFFIQLFFFPIQMNIIEGEQSMPPQNVPSWHTELLN